MSSQFPTSIILPAEKEPSVATGSEIVWTQQTDWTLKQKHKFLNMLKIEPQSSSP
jgi:hypothetical protein